MRVAISNWDDRVSPVLDAAAGLTLIDYDGESETGRQAVPLAGGVWQRARQLGGLGLDVLICGAVSRPLYDLLLAAGVEVVPFVAGEVDRVITAFLRGELPDRTLTLPGCRCRWRGGPCRGPHGRRLNENKEFPR